MIRPRATRTALAAVAAIGLLAACGTDDAADEAAASETTDPADVDADGADEPEAAEAADDAPAVPASAPDPEDGWNGTDGLDPVGPGAGVLQVAGETIDLEVTCSTPGPLEDHELFAFAFNARGDGIDSEGRDVYVEVARRLTTEPESFYDYDGYEQGTVQIVVATGDESSPFHSSIVVSPADDDSAGQQLPVVRVEESGTFTVVADVPGMMFHDQALEGPTELVGTCQETWPDDFDGGVPMF